MNSPNQPAEKSVVVSVSLPPKSLAVLDELATRLQLSRSRVVAAAVDCLDRMPSVLEAVMVEMMSRLYAEFVREVGQPLLDEAEAAGQAPPTVPEFTQAMRQCASLDPLFPAASREPATGATPVVALPRRPFKRGTMRGGEHGLPDRA